MLTSLSLSAFAAEVVPATWEASANTSWYNATATEFEISTAEQLAGLAKLVNDGNTFVDKTIYLTADIDLTGKTWTPIGIYKTTLNGAAVVKDIPFNGTFIATNDKASVSDEIVAHTVKGIAVHNIDSTNFSYLGLFGNIGAKGIVTDLGVNGLTITGNIANARLGGVAGANHGIIENVYNNGAITASVTVNDGTTAYGYAAGIVGANHGTISGSYNTGVINAGTEAAGIALYNYKTITSSYNTGAIDGGDTAGIAHTNNAGAKISLSYNTGAIGENGSSGGIATNNFGIIDSVYNAGTVIADNGVSGGIVGNLFGGRISDAYNTQKVSAANAGGIVGQINLNTNPASISSSYSSGIATGKNKGGVVGYIPTVGKPLNVNHVYYKNETSGLPTGNSLITTKEVSKIVSTKDLLEKMNASPAGDNPSEDRWVIHNYSVVHLKKLLEVFPTFESAPDTASKLDSSLTSIKDEFNAEFKTGVISGTGIFTTISGENFAKVDAGVFGEVPPSVMDAARNAGAGLLVMDNARALLLSEGSLPADAPNIAFYTFDGLSRHSTTAAIAEGYTKNFSDMNKAELSAVMEAMAASEGNASGAKMKLVTSNGEVIIGG